MAPSRALHLRIQFHVRVVGVVQGALAMRPLVCVILPPLSVSWQLYRAFGEIAEEVERLAEGVLGRSGKCARRVHRVRFIAGVQERKACIAEVWCS
jgi:hypothetical protein